MKSVFPAKLAILVCFQSVGVILLVLGGVVVSLLALRAGEYNLILSHYRHLLIIIASLTRKAKLCLFLRIKKKHLYAR